MSRRLLIAVGVALTLVGGCAVGPQSAVTDLSDIERTWFRATIVLPPLGAVAPVRTTINSAAMRAHMQRLPAGARLPVVVYVHGCTGLANFAFLDRLAESGFVVVAPDSFARRYRPLQCDPVTRTGGRHLFVYDFRMEEVSFALEQLWTERWADWNRMFLVGTSEGGVTAALYRGDEFKARVIAQWTCTGAPHVAGIEAPGDEPILAVRGAQDPWYGPANAGDCRDAFGPRPDSRSLVFDLPAGHDVFAESAVVATITEFLRAQATLP
ncbi:MAG: hypothetical protein EXQ93_03850 [Alphaproteobacteria bacterium]|nr:hypothetical protein [Alphaproteobacteria bacterium]